MNTFSPTEAIKFGWATFKKNAGFTIGVIVIVYIIQAIVSMLSGGGPSFNFSIDQTTSSYQTSSGSLLGGIGTIIGAIVSILLSLGLVKAFLNLVNNGKGDFKDLFVEFTNFKVLINYIIASIVVGFIVIGGFFLLIIPGIYLGARLGLFQYYIIEKEMGAMDSVKASWHATSGNVINILVFGFLSFLVIIAGVVALLVGLLVAVPVVILADIYVYKMLSQQPAGTVASAPVAPATPTPPAAPTAV